MPKKLPASKGNSASRYVLNLLSRRDYSVVELQRKLKQKGYSMTEIARLITKLQDQHLVDDQALAERYVRSILMTRAVGPRWIKAKLQQKGIASAIITNELEQQFTLTEEQRLLTQAATTWRRRHQGPKATTEKLGRFLLSRGFSPMAVQQLLGNSAQSSDSFDDGGMS